MEIVSKIESDASNNTGSNAWFSHFLLGQTSSSAFAHVNNNNNLKHNNSSISTHPNDPTEDDDDEFGDFESVPAQSSNNIASVDPSTNGDKAFSFDCQDDFGDFESPPPPPSNNGKRFTIQPQQLSGLPFPFPVSHETAAVFPATDLLDLNAPLFSFSSNFETLDQNNAVRTEAIPDRHASARPIRDMHENASARTKQSIDQDDAARIDHAEVRVPVESNGTGTDPIFDEDWGDFVETPIKDFWQHDSSEVNGIGASGGQPISYAVALDRNSEVSTVFSNFSFDLGPSVEANKNEGDGSLDLFGDFNVVEHFGRDSRNGVSDRSFSNGITDSLAPEADSNSANTAINSQEIGKPIDEKSGQKKSAIENTSKPLPLSLFGEEEADCKIDSEEKSALNLFDNHVEFQRNFDGHKSSLDSVIVSNAGLQFNDFIEQLYRQAEKDGSSTVANGDKGSVIEQKVGNISVIPGKRDSSIVDGNNLVDIVSETGTNSDIAKSQTHFFGNSDEDFDWEFKDAFSEPDSKSGVYDFGSNAESVKDRGDQFIDSSEPDNDKLRDLVAFYIKLRGESHSFALDHLSTLEEALSVATESNNADKAEAIAKEIQAATENLGKAKDLLEQHEMQEHQFKNATVEEMLGQLHHSSLLAFESEFHLAELTSSAKEDLRVAVDLHQHAVSVLRILACASIQEQSAYLSVWATMTATCAAELQHGVNIWTQALDANVHMDILVHPRGRGYFASLGEVFRVSEILKASIKLCRPWILLNSDQAKCITENLKNCKAVWVESGLREAVCHALATDDNSNSIYSTSWKIIEQLSETVESMEQAHLVDALHAAVQKSQPVCRLSLLPISVFDGLKEVDWSGQHYFLPLANLWANCISCKPPQLPVIRV